MNKCLLAAFSLAFSLLPSQLLTAQTTGTARATHPEGGRPLVGSITRFESQYLDGSFRFTSEETYVRGPAWPAGTVISRKQGICRRNSNAGMWIEVLDSQKAPFHSIACETPEELSPDDIPDRIDRMSAHVVSTDTSINVSGHKENPKEEVFVVTGTLKDNRGRARWKEVGDHVFHDDLNFLFGYEHYLANGPQKFSELLACESLETESGQLNGQDVILATVKTPHGKITAWFRRPSLLLQKVEVLRDATDRVSGTHLVGDLYGYCTGGNGSHLTGLKHTFSDLRYTEIDGKMYCSGFTFRKQEEFARDGEAVTTKTVSLTRIDPGVPEIGSRSVDFELFSIPEKTRFYAEDSHSIPYIIEGNQISKVIDESTLESVDGVRYAMPGERNWTPALLAIGVVTLFAGLFLYKKRQSF